MSLLAAIDVGTNSVRLLIAKLDEKELKPILREVITTRIGEGIGTSRTLRKAAITRTVDAIEQFYNTANQHNAHKIFIFATSAVRDAENKELFIKEVFDRIGIYPEIISGEKEAELSFVGASSMLVPVPKELVVIDIGGGSTEIIYEHKKICGVSVPLGAVRLAEKTYTDEYLNNEFKKIVDAVPYKNPVLVAVGGTATSLASILQGLDPYDPAKVQGYTLQASDVKRTMSHLFSLSLEERKKIKGLQPERADIIPYGIKILVILIELLDASKIIVSESDLLEGRMLKA